MKAPYRDSEQLLRDELHDLALQRWAQLQRKSDAELQIAQLDAEVASIESRLPFPSRAPGRRPGLWLVVALAGIGAGLTAFQMLPGGTRKYRPREAQVGAQTIRQATELFSNLHDPPCPRIEDLVAAKLLDPGKGLDPWGRPYRIECSASGVFRVLSSGKDSVAGSTDDIADDFKPADLAHLD